MEALGGLLAVFGVVVFPLILIIGLIKPTLFKKPDKTPLNRKEIAVFCVIASLVCLGVAAAMLPEAEPKADDSVQAEANTDKQENTKADDTQKATTKAVKDETTKQKTLPDFGITSDEFVKNYNTIISQIDENMIISGIEDDGAIKYAPMPDNVSMGGIVEDNGNLRGVILTLGGSEDASDNLNATFITLAAANAVQGSDGQEEIGKAVTDLIPAAVNNPNESQKIAIGNSKYAANFIPELGGVIFTIDAVK